MHPDLCRVLLRLMADDGCDGHISNSERAERLRPGQRRELFPGLL